MPRLNAFAVLLLAASTLLAKPPGSYPLGWLRIQGGPLNESNSEGIKTPTGYGAGLGMWFNRWLGAELDVLTARLKDENDLWEANETHMDLALLFAPPTVDGSWKPYLRLGGGATRLEQPLALVPRTSTRANYVAGLGLQGFLGSHGLVTLEARGTDVRSSTPRTEIQYLVGLGLRWGGKAPAARPYEGSPDLFLQRPLIEKAEPAPGREPAVQPAEPGQNPAVQPAEPGKNPIIQVTPPGEGPAVPLIQKAEP